MPGTPANVRVWDYGDLWVFDPAVPFVTATHIPATVDAALHAAWLPMGLILGDPGIEMPRDIEETDMNAWQLKRYRTKWKNGKVDGNATILEDNEVTEALIDPTKVPGAKYRHLCMFFRDDSNQAKERRFTKVPAALFVENDNQAEETNGRPVRIRFYPDSTGTIFSIQKGAPV